MIIPNLLVADMDSSIAFYRDLLGMEVTMSVDADQGYSEGELIDGVTIAGAPAMLEVVKQGAATLSRCQRRKRIVGT